MGGCLFREWPPHGKMVMHLGYGDVASMALLWVVRHLFNPRQNGLFRGVHMVAASPVEVNEPCLRSDHGSALARD